MTPKKFDAMPAVKDLFRKKDFLKASLMAKSIGNLTKNSEMRKHAQRLLKIHQRQEARNEK